MHDSGMGGGGWSTLDGDVAVGALVAGLVDGRRLLRRPLDHSPEAGDLLVGSVQLLR